MKSDYVCWLGRVQVLMTPKTCFKCVESDQDRIGCATPHSVIGLENSRQFLSTNQKESLNQLRLVRSRLLRFRSLLVLSLNSHWLIVIYIVLCPDWLIGSTTLNRNAGSRI